MASNQTQHLQLCQWEAEDEVLRADFNADNAKIDAAVAAAEGKITAAQTALAQLAARAGNCVVVSGSYTGTGSYGPNGANTLEFPHRVMAVLLDNDYYMVRGKETARYLPGGSSSSSFPCITWGERTISWYCSINWENQCNNAGQTYYYVALLDAEH